MMKSKTKAASSFTIWRASLLSLALLLPPSTAAVAATSQKTRRKRRHKSTTSATKLVNGNSDESLKERWVDILSQQYDYNNSVRMENQQEEQYYHEAEILADKLLLRLVQNNNYNGSFQNNKNSSSLLSKELSIAWKSISIASAGILIGIPIAALFSSILTSNMMQNMIASIQSSITPYLLPTLSMASSSIKSYLLQAQAITHSMPYLLRHIHHIKIRPGPFLYKVLRKCIIVEAWRHIWIRVYKLTRYLWRGTLKNAKSAYVRLCPAWIRRGVKSVFQSMVQAQVHGAVGGFVGSALSGVTFESFGWSNGADGGDSVSSSLVIDSETIVDSIQDAAMVESMTDSAAQSFGTTMHEAMDSVSVEDTIDAFSESLGSAVEDAVESIISEDAVDAIVESVVESSSIGDALESIVEDCLAEGCVVDEVMESILE